jgi:hypothetical protein
VGRLFLGSMVWVLISGCTTALQLPPSLPVPPNLTQRDVEAVMRPTATEPPARAMSGDGVLSNMGSGGRETAD